MVTGTQGSTSHRLPGGLHGHWNAIAWQCSSGRTGGDRAQGADSPRRRRWPRSRRRSRSPCPTPRGIGTWTRLRLRSAPPARPGGGPARDATSCADPARVADDISPSPKDKRFADPAWASNPGLPTPGPGATSSLGSSADPPRRRIRGRRRRLAGGRAGALRRQRSHQRPGAHEHTARQPGSAQAGHRHRRAQPRPRARTLAERRPAQRRMPSMVERDAFEVGKGPPRSRPVPCSSATRWASSCSTNSRAPSGCTSVRWSSSRRRWLLLLPRPAPGPQLHRVRHQPGHPGVPAQLAQPDRRTRRVGSRHLRRRASSRAIDVVREITESDDVNTLGFCAGGILTHDGAQPPRRHRRRPASTAPAYAVTLLDFHQRAPIGAFSGAPACWISRARNSSRAGVITARQMGAVFTWMRPDDLVFNYLVSEWLLGDEPPAFDILAWNADGTNLPARLHGQFLEIFGANSLVRAGQYYGCSARRYHLSRITVPTFVTGAVHRPPHTVGGLLPDDAAAIGAQHVRVEQRRAHPEPGESTGQPEGQLLDRRRARRGRPGVAGGGPAAHRQLVGALGAVAARPLRRRNAGAREPRFLRPSGPGTGARRLRRRPLPRLSPARQRSRSTGTVVVDRPRSQ